MARKTAAKRKVTRAARKPAPRLSKAKPRSKQAVKVPAPVPPAVHGHRKVVLVYPGEHTTYLIREFSTQESAERFVAANRLTMTECAWIDGTVKKCDPRYRSDRNTCPTPPWYAGDDSEDVTLPSSDEIPLSAATLQMSDVQALLEGKV